VTGWSLVGFLLGSGALGVNFGYPGQPHILVRYMAMRCGSEAVRGGIIAGIWMLLVVWGAVTIGVMARALAEGGADWGAGLLLGAGVDGAIDRENALIVTASNMLPGVLAGMVLAAILAAICSTADSQIVIAASAVANDLWVRLVRKDGGDAHPAVNRFAVIALGIGAMVIVIDQDVNVYQYVLTYGWAVLGAAFGPQLILALMWRRATYAGCIAGMSVSFLLPIVWNLTYGASEREIQIYNLPLAFTAALAVNVAVSLVVYHRGRAGG